jgi:hypothetical protein
MAKSWHLELFSLILIRGPRTSINIGTINSFQLTPISVDFENLPAALPDPHFAFEFTNQAPFATIWICHFIGTSLTLL